MYDKRSNRLHGTHEISIGVIISCPNNTKDKNQMFHSLTVDPRGMLAQGKGAIDTLGISNPASTTNNLHLPSWTAFKSSTDNQPKIHTSRCLPASLSCHDSCWHVSMSLERGMLGRSVSILTLECKIASTVAQCANASLKISQRESDDPRVSHAIFACPFELYLHGRCGSTFLPWSRHSLTCLAYIPLFEPTSYSSIVRKYSHYLSLFTTLISVRRSSCLPALEQPFVL